MLQLLKQEHKERLQRISLGDLEQLAQHLLKEEPLVEPTGQGQPEAASEPMRLRGGGGGWSVNWPVLLIRMLTFTWPWPCVSPADAPPGLTDVHASSPLSETSKQRQRDSAPLCPLLGMWSSLKHRMIPPPSPS